MEQALDKGGGRARAIRAIGNDRERLNDEKARLKRRTAEAQGIADPSQREIALRACQVEADQLAEREKGLDAASDHYFERTGERERR